MDRLKRWWSARSTRTKAIIIGAIALYAVSTAVSPRGSTPEAMASPAAAATATATAPRTTAPPTTPAPTATPRAFIQGMTNADVKLNLEKRGFQCGAPKAGSAGTTRLEIVECVSTDQYFVYNVTYASESPTRVRLVTATIAAIRLLDPATANPAAGVFLGFVATLPYDRAEPQRAHDWARANVANKGATLTIADAHFEIAETTKPGESYRLNIIAVGARP